MILALLIFVILYVYCSRKKVEMVSPLKLFCVSVSCAPSAVILSMLIGVAVQKLLSIPDAALIPPEDIHNHFLYAFFVAGFNEELTKLIALLLVLRVLKDQHKPVQVMLLMLSISLGCTLLEDAMYIGFLIKDGFPYRVIIPGHFIFGGLMGLLIVQAMKAEQKPKKIGLYVLAYVVPSLCHGFFDFIGSISWWGIFVLVTFTVMCLTVFLWYFVTMIREEAAGSPEPATE